MESFTLYQGKGKGVAGGGNSLTLCDKQFDGEHQRIAHHNPLKYMSNGVNKGRKYISKLHYGFLGPIVLVTVLLELPLLIVVWICTLPL